MGRLGDLRDDWSLSMLNLVDGVVVAVDGVVTAAAVGKS